MDDKISNSNRQRLASLMQRAIERCNLQLDDIISLVGALNGRSSLQKYDEIVLAEATTGHYGLTSDNRPGVNRQRLVNLMQQSIQRCDLNLRGATVLTEAATGAYIVTPIIAAMAGAEQVFAIARSSRYGTIEQVMEQTYQLAEIAGVTQRVKVITQKTKDVVAQADIITNSNHVRPINAEMISWMKPTAVIPLMYETWELRPDDVDVAKCRQQGIKVAGTNERHPDVDVFSFLGLMAIKLLVDAGIAVYKSNILLLCDNHFSTFIENGLSQAGANVNTYGSMMAVPKGKTYDAVLVAMQPQSEPVLSAVEAVLISEYWRGIVVAQFWGDIERVGFHANGIPVWPPESPQKGHMAILPSAVGPEPIVRLQSGGLKVGELLWRSFQTPKLVGGNSNELLNTGFVDAILC